jgi:hypothetical protein
MAAQQGFDMLQFVAPPTPTPPFGSPPGARVYIFNVGFYIFINITIFSINDMFYVIQFFHSLAGHDGGSSSHRNELTPRDSKDHSNQPNKGNNI